MTRKGNMQIFRGGLPYGPQVKRLNEAFPLSVLTEGRTLTHDDIEPVVQCERKTQRYYGVVNSWIAQQKNQNGVIMIWDPGSGIKVLDPAGILNHAEKRTHQKLKQAGRAVKIFGYVDRNRLDSVGQSRFDHVTMVTAKMTPALTDFNRQLAVDIGPVKSLPKPRIVKA